MNKTLSFFGCKQLFSGTFFVADDNFVLNTCKGGANYMKKYIFISILIISNLTSFAQKYDNNWIFGYDACTGDTSIYAPLFSGSRVYFNNDSLNIDSVCVKVNLGGTNASISDAQGNFLFHTNGYTIGNTNFDTLENGTGLSPGGTMSQNLYYGNTSSQPIIILPHPTDSTQYYLFYLSTYSGGGGTYLYSLKIYYAIVKFDNLHPKGYVTAKNIVISTGNFVNGGITACKHANGRDWWVIVPHRNSYKMETILFSDIGIESTTSQIIPNIKNAFTGGGSGVFSPDGTKYARYDTSYVTVYNFDRCTGVLTYQDTVFPPLWYAWGMCFSPNSKYLYAHNGQKLYQYDADSADIGSTSRLVGEYDGFVLPPPYPAFPTNFFLMQNAPDGKIYLSTTNSTPYLHVIHSPDSFGTACNFEQHAIKLKGYNAFGIPNFPNYRLGALVGSPCDTLTSKEEGIRKEVNVYPNPVEKELSILLQNVQEKTTFVLYDALGKQILLQSILQGAEIVKINVALMPKGMYFYLLKSEKGILAQGKIIKE
jgi:hypothetical protein